MKILVCIKQVPDMESRFKPDASGVRYEEADLAFRMNEYDEYAVEEAVHLKEQLDNLPEVTVLSVGPDRVVEALRKALAMGCDRAVHVKDGEASAKDPWQIASGIASCVKDQGYDLIFTGMQSQDRGSAQVGVILAELLGIACATTLVGFAYDQGTVTAKRELEGGVKGGVKLQTPCLVTCQLGLNTPRYPTLPNIMKAKKKELVVLAEGDVPGADSLARTTSFHAPAKKGCGVVLEGDVPILVDQVLSVLKEKTAVLR